MDFVIGDALNGLIGGLMIGCAAALLLLANGRIAGISGIAAILVGGGDRSDGFEKLAFLVGLVVAPLLYATLIARPEIGITSNPFVLVIAGLLVGVGTRLGNGCTSGHGVCGLSRFSTRSLAAVLTFMAVAVVVASGVTLVTGAGQ